MRKRIYALISLTPPAAGRVKAGLARGVCLLLLCAVAAQLAACSSPLSTERLRAEMLSGNLPSLEQELRDDDEASGGALVNALNLARVLQLQGRRRESAAAFEKAAGILEEYEDRAELSARNLAGAVGRAAISRGSGGYYGRGYERALLHTLNALNYLLDGDFAGAAVEMRRMERRQELWLAEKEQRLLELAEAGGKSADASANWAPPQGYSMRALLENPALRADIDKYQDPFSYALSSVICRIAGDTEYAAVSMRRAASLSPEARALFRAAWGAPGGGAPAFPPPLPPAGAAEQELTLVLLGGLAPALKMERLRIANSLTGYLLVDLPAYTPALPDAFSGLWPPESGLKVWPLLRADLLAYKDLADDMDYEVFTAVSRALTRASASIAGQALASSNEKTRDSAPLVGLFLSLVMDLLASSGDLEARNWETLPASGYLGINKIRRGAAFSIDLGRGAETLTIPPEARGMVLVISRVGASSARMDYVVY